MKSLLQISLFILLGLMNLNANSYDLKTYFKEVSKLDNKGRYEIGTLVVPVGTIFIPAVGQASKMGRTKELLKGLKSLSKTKKKEFFEEIVKKADNVVVKVAKFTSKQIDEYVKMATNVGKGANKDKILLGEFIKDSPNSYVTRAKKEGYTYFDMGDKWDEAIKIVRSNDDEMWRINKKFIDNQKALGKEFYFSQEPWKFPNSPNLTFRFREAEYLIDIGAKDFKKINENTWKVIW